MGGIFNEFMTEVYGAFSKNKCKIYINVNVFPWILCNESHHTYKREWVGDAI